MADDSRTRKRLRWSCRRKHPNTPDALIAIAGPRATLMKLARFTSLPLSTLSDMFNGRRGVDGDALCTVADALHVPAQQLRATILRYAVARDIAITDIDDDVHDINDDDDVAGAADRRQGPQSRRRRAPPRAGG